MLTCQKALFDLPEAIHYLNCATISPNLRAAIEAGTAGILRKSKPHLVTSTDFFTEAAQTRALVAQLIHCSSPDRIALVPSVSYGMATVAKNLARKPDVRAGQEILLIFEEFPSDVYAWEEVCAEKALTIRTIAPPASTDFMTSRGQVWNERILDAIGPQTCLVMVPHVHWTDGTRFDLAAIRQRSREVGAWLVVDGSQSVGVLPFDVQAFQPDALIGVGYKCLLGPYGMSVSYWSETFDDGVPLEQNWINRVGSEDFGQLVDYQRAHRPQAARYNMGQQSNFILLPMLNAALSQLLQWGPEAIQDYCRRLTTDSILALRTMGYWVEDDAWRGSHLFGIRLPEGVSMNQVRQSLTDHHISASVRSTSIRVSTHVWNTPEDLNALLAALEAALPRG